MIVYGEINARKKKSGLYQANVKIWDDAVSWNGTACFMPMTGLSADDVKCKVIEYIHGLNNEPKPAPFVPPVVVEEKAPPVVVLDLFGDPIKKKK